MKKFLSFVLAGAMTFSLAACSNSSAGESTAETATAENSDTATPEVANGATANYDLGLGEDGYFRDVVAEKYIKMPKDWEMYTVDESVYTITDEEIEDEFDYFKSNYQLMVEVDRAIEDGDVVNIAYDGSVDGVPFTGGESTSYDLEIGSGTFIDGFEEQLIGHSKGDTFDVTVTFPDGYSSTTDRETGETTIELANEEAVFNVTINTVSVYDVTDADVADIMSGSTLNDGTEVNTVDKLKQYIKENLALSNVNDDVQQYFIDNVTTKRNTTKLVDAYLDTNRNYIEEQAAEYDMDSDTFVSTYSDYATLDEYVESLRSQGEQNVLLSLVCQYMAEKQDYKPTEDDVRSYIGEDYYDEAVETYGAGPLAHECMYNKIMGNYCLEVYNRSIAGE